MKYLVPRWSLYHSEPLATLVAYSREDAFKLVPLGARLVAISKDMTVWTYAGVEYQLPRICARAGLGSYRNSTIRIGDKL